MRIQLSKPLATLALTLVLAACGGGDGADIDASAAGDAAPTAADAAASTATDAGPSTPDAASSGTNPDADVGNGVACGDQTCGADDECCFQLGEDPSCVERGSCEGAAVSCTSPTHCGEGQVCCTNAGQLATSCVDECNQLVVCDTEDDCLNENHQCCPLGDLSICSRFC